MNPTVDYVGTKELNKAFLSRFPIVMEVDYLPEEREIEVVKKSPRAAVWLNLFEP